MQIALKEWLAQNGYSSAEDALTEYSEFDSVYPALCSEGCEVEPPPASVTFWVLQNRFFPENFLLNQNILLRQFLNLLEPQATRPVF